MLGDADKIMGMRVAMIRGWMMGLAAVAVCSGLDVAVVRGEVTGWRGPRFLQVEASGSILVVCEKSGTVARVDARDGTILAETAVGEGAFMVTAHPDGERLYVSVRREGSVVELSAESLAVLRRFPLGGDPTGVAISADGLALYVGVHSLDSVAVLDLATGRALKSLSAGNGPEYPARDPASGRWFWSNLLSDAVGADRAPELEITAIDDGRRRVVERIVVHGALAGKVMAFTHDGSMALMAAMRPKNLIPFTQVARGWCMGNGFVVLRPGRGSGPVMLLVDEPNRAYADPCGMAILPDDGKAYMSCSASDTVIVLDLQGVARVVEEVRGGGISDAGEDLGLSRRYVVARVRVGANPTAVSVSRDGREVYVANRLADSISVIDTATDRVIREMVLGNPPVADGVAMGERYFHTARASFQGQIGCISCHPDRGFDGLTWDLEPDGMGLDPLDNRNLRGVSGTGPFKWNGKNADITTQCGTRTAKWIFRTQGFSPVEVSRLAEYIRSLEPVDNPYRDSRGGPTAAQRRGKAIFERTVLNDGSPLPAEQRCTTCHSGIKFSNYAASDVGTRAERGTVDVFDSPHLINVFESSPYLHDGRARTLEEIWTVHNREDRHGVSSDWTQQQLNDLVEYLKSL